MRREYSGGHVISGYLRQAVPFEQGRKARLVRLGKAIEEENVAQGLEPGARRGRAKCPAQPRYLLWRSGCRGDKGRRRRALRHRENADSSGEMWRIPRHEQVPVRIEWTDIDASLAYAIENVARGDELTEHLRIELGTLRRAVCKQMMAERIETRMRVLHGPPGSRAKRVSEGTVGRIPADDGFGAISRTALRPRCTRDRCCDGDYGRKL